jgi:hypothetical protein
MSNCLIFVLVRWLRDGGFVIARKSNNGWWPHFFWTADLVVFEEYTPKYPNKHLLCPPPLYQGIVKVTNAQEQRAGKLKR